MMGYEFYKEFQNGIMLMKVQRSTMWKHAKFFQEKL